MDFFEHQDQARRKTKRLLGLFILAILLIVFTLNLAVFFAGNASGFLQLNPTEYMTSKPFMLVCIGALIVILAGSLFRAMQVNGGGKSIASLVKGRKVMPDTKDLKERQLLNVVEEMSIASGTPIPEVYIMDNEQGLNAFVAGLEVNDTVLVVTGGLLDSLNRQELQGVIAHEYSHIFNADMRLNLRLIAILGGILAIGQLGYYMLRSLRYSGSRRSSSKDTGQLIAVLFAASVCLLVIGYIGLFFGRLIKAAISRQREFLADAAAVQFSRDNMGIASALYKIKTNGKGSLLESSHAEDMSHMCFGNALNITAFSNMLATHPPVDERIKAILPTYKYQKGEAQFVEAASAQAGTSQESPVMGFQAVSNSSEVLERVGQLDESQLEHTRERMNLIPALLTDAAHDRKKVSALVISLLMRVNPLSMQELNELASDTQLFEEEDLRSILPLCEELDELKILPVIDLSIPTLKLLSSSEHKQLLKLCEQIILSDKQVLPFEFFIDALLRKHLDPLSTTKATIKQYRHVLNDLAMVFSQLTSLSNEDSAKQLTTLEQVMQSYSAGWRAGKQLQAFDSVKLHDALNRLNRLSPMLKRPFLQTCADIIMQDNRAEAAELEILRAIAIHLDCPMPQLI